jgi:hypothetical protein
MLTFQGSAGRFCDGHSRRSFLRVGALGLGGLTLAQLMKAEAAGGKGKSHKSVIMVYLSGGMAHQDTFDLKPDAPAEVRGEFKPIDTNVSGVKFGDQLPRLAKVMDKLVVLRAVVGQPDEHSSWMSYTGIPMDAAKREKRPHFGSVVAKVQGPTHPLVPAFVDAVAKLGGYLGRKGDGPPGWQSLWRGDQRLADTLLGLELAERLATRKPRLPHDVGKR